jgi:hypothetical protein
MDAGQLAAFLLFADVEEEQRAEVASHVLRISAMFVADYRELGAAIPSLTASRRETMRERIEQAPPRRPWSPPEACDRRSRSRSAAATLVLAARPAPARVVAARGPWDRVARPEQFRRIDAPRLGRSRGRRPLSPPRRSTPPHRSLPRRGGGRARGRGRGGGSRSAGRRLAGRQGHRRDPASAGVRRRADRAEARRAPRRSAETGYGAAEDGLTVGGCSGLQQMGSSSSRPARQSSSRPASNNVGASRYGSKIASTMAMSAIVDGPSAGAVIAARTLRKNGRLRRLPPGGARRRVLSNHSHERPAGAGLLRSG